MFIIIIRFCSKGFKSIQSTKSPKSKTQQGFTLRVFINSFKQQNQPMFLNQVTRIIEHNGTKCKKQLKHQQQSKQNQGPCNNVEGYRVNTTISCLKQIDTRPTKTLLIYLEKLFWHSKTLAKLFIANERFIDQP